MDARVTYKLLTIFESFPTHERPFLVSVALPWLLLITLLKLSNLHKSCHAAHARSIRFPFIHCNLVCAFHLGFLASQAACAHIRWCRIFSAPWRGSYSSSWVVPVSARLVSADSCLEYYSPRMVVRPDFSTHYTRRSSHAHVVGSNVNLRALSMQCFLSSKYHLPMRVLVYLLLPVGYCIILASSHSEHCLHPSGNRSPSIATPTRNRCVRSYPCVRF